MAKIPAPTPKLSFSPAFAFGLILLPIITALAVFAYTVTRSNWRDLNHEAQLIAARAPLIETKTAAGMAMDKLEAISYLQLSSGAHLAEFDLALDQFKAAFSAFQQALDHADRTQKGDEGLIEALQREVDRFLEQHGDLDQPSQVPDASWRFFSSVGWPSLSPPNGHWNALASTIDALDSVHGLAYDHFDSVAARLFDRSKLAELPPGTAAWIKSIVSSNDLEAATTEGEPLDQRGMQRVFREAIDIEGLARLSEPLAGELGAMMRSGRGFQLIRSTSPFVLGLTEDLELTPDELLEQMEVLEAELLQTSNRAEDVFAKIVDQDLAAAGRRKSIAAIALSVPVLLVLALLFAGERRQHALNRALVKAAEQDPLTSLPNRFALQRRAKLLFGEPADQVRDGHASLVLIDLDNFKAINDAFGHHVGDGVLVQFAHRLASIARNQEQAFRLGGDEFVVLNTGNDDPDRADLLAAEIQQALTEPISVDGHRLRLEASCGASTRKIPTELSDLLIEADLALHEVKERRKSGFLHYRQTRRGALIRELPGLLSAESLHFAFQPQVSLESGEVTGLEGLCRWPKAPSGSSFRPIDVIDSVEWLGHIDRFMDNLIHRFERLHALLGDRFHGRFWLNVWPSQLEAPDLERSLLAIFQRSSLPLDRLGIEITEKRMIGDTKHTRESVEMLRNHGVAVALDDFGVFNASIERLTAVPLDVVKLDQRLVQGISEKIEHRLFVKALREICHSRQLRIIAEGAEALPDLVTLRELDIDEVQGFFVRPAMSPTDLVDFLEQWDPRAFARTL